MERKDSDFTVENSCCSGENSTTQTTCTGLKIAFPSCIYSTQDASGRKTSIKEGVFHLCITQIWGYHTAWEDMPIYSGLLGRCRAARVKCCCVGVKQLQISCVCAEECCVFVLQLTNRLPFWATSRNFTACLEKNRRPAQMSPKHIKTHTHFNKAVTQRCVNRIKCLKKKHIFLHTRLVM